jgi:hypothetical protein
MCPSTPRRAHGALDVVAVAAATTIAKNIGISIGKVAVSPNSSIGVNGSLSVNVTSAIPDFTRATPTKVLEDANVPLMEIPQAEEMGMSRAGDFVGAGSVR